MLAVGDGCTRVGDAEAVAGSDPGLLLETVQRSTSLTDTPYRLSIDPTVSLGRTTCTSPRDAAGRRVPPRAILAGGVGLPGRASAVIT